MRLAAALVVFLTACGSASRPPAWPKQSPRDAETDGGESLAPRATATSILAVERAPEPAEKAAAAARAEKAGERASLESIISNSIGSAIGGSPADPEEPINTDEIVIEIKDD
jgi:hypothetical protein